MQGRSMQDGKCLIQHSKWQSYYAQSLHCMTWHPLIHKGFSMCVVQGGKPRHKQDKEMACCVCGSAGNGTCR